MDYSSSPRFGSPLPWKLVSNSADQWRNLLYPWQTSNGAIQLKKLWRASIRRKMHLKLQNLVLVTSPGRFLLYSCLNTIYGELILYAYTEKQLSPSYPIFYAESDSVNNAYQWKRESLRQFVNLHISVSSCFSNMYIIEFFTISQ